MCNRSAATNADSPGRSEHEARPPVGAGLPCLPAGAPARPLTVLAEAPLVVSVVVGGGCAPEPGPALHDTLLVVLPIEQEGEHTRVAVLSFWEGEIRVTLIICTASAAPGRGGHLEQRFPEGSPPKLTDCSWARALTLRAGRMDHSVCWGSRHLERHS